MRVIIAILLASAAWPALADQASADRFIQEQWDKIHEVRADNARRAAAHKALCAKVGGVHVGLTKDGVLRSCWGRPYHINTTTTARGVHEQWVYDSAYVYFDDGVVTAVQTSR